MSTALLDTTARQMECAPSSMAPLFVIVNSLALAHLVTMVISLHPTTNAILWGSVSVRISAKGSLARTSLVVSLVLALLAIAFVVICSMSSAHVMTAMTALSMIFASMARVQVCFFAQERH